MVVSGIRERFGKGLSTEEKLTDSKKMLDNLSKNLSILIGGREITPQIADAMAAYTAERQIHDHLTAAVARKEAERKAREIEAAENAKKAEIANRFAGVIAAVVAKGGSADPATVVEMIRNMSGDDLSALLKNAPGASK